MKELEKRIKLLEKLLEQSLNYLGLEVVGSDDQFHKEFIHEFLERGRKVLKNDK